MIGFGAKLSDQQVHEVRAAYEHGMGQRLLARMSGVSQAQVSAIVNGTAYRWLNLGKIDRRKRAVERAGILDGLRGSQCV